MFLLSLFINVMHPCWIEVLISPKFWMVVLFIHIYLVVVFSQIKAAQAEEKKFQQHILNQQKKELNSLLDSRNASTGNARRAQGGVLSKSQLSLWLHDYEFRVTLLDVALNNKLIKLFMSFDLHHLHQPHFLSLTCFCHPEILPHGNRSWVRTSPLRSERSRNGWWGRKSVCSKSRLRKRLCYYGDRGSITSCSADNIRERCCSRDTI